jgi:hypothetical protein
VRFPKMPPIASITPKKRTLSVVAGERIAEALGSSREKSMPVLITRVPARERPVRRIPKTLKTLDTSLTGNVPEGPVAVPARG